MNVVLKPATQEGFGLIGLEMQDETLEFPALPLCPICNSEVFFFWNGNGYCSKTYTTIVRVKGGKCTSTGGVPVIKIPSTRVEAIFGERPKGYYKYANPILINIHKKSCESR